MRYLVIYEKLAAGWGAHSPDLPGLAAEGKTLDEVKQLIHETMELHLEGMHQHGARIPAPSAAIEYIGIDRHA